MKKREVGSNVHFPLLYPKPNERLQNIMSIRSLARGATILVGTPVAVGAGLVEALSEKSGLTPVLHEGVEGVREGMGRLGNKRRGVRDMITDPEFRAAVKAAAAEQRAQRAAERASQAEERRVEPSTGEPVKGGYQGGPVITRAELHLQEEIG